MKKIAWYLWIAALPFSIGAAPPPAYPGSALVETVAALEDVTQGDVINYLETRGYTVVSAVQIEGTCNWSCSTYLGGLHYTTTVFTNCSIITGHEDVEG